MYETTDLCRAIGAEPPDGEAMEPQAPAKHAFNRAVEMTMARRKAISDQRGGEYLDTWALANVRTAFLDAVLRTIGIDPDSLTVEEARLIEVACLADVKVSRLIGPYKADTYDDLCNYLDALSQWLGEYTGESE